VSQVRSFVGRYVATLGAVVASYGGPEVYSDQVLIRAFIRGPTSTAVDLYIGPEAPNDLAGLGQRQADYTLTGRKDYASWQPPLALPAGWYAAFVWTGGIFTTSSSTVRLEYDDAGGWF
jgi:hypothetical protein